MDVRTRRGPPSWSGSHPSNRLAGTRLARNHPVLSRLHDQTSSGLRAVEYWRCLVLYHYDGNYLVLSRPRDEPSSCARPTPFPNRTKRCNDYR